MIGSWFNIPQDCIISAIERKAIQYATVRHGEINQIRKYTGQPYIVHPQAVANIVRTVPHTPEMLAAAWLHDVVEDTPTTIEEIEFEFGKTVGNLVSDLTDVSCKEDGNRKVRKAIDRQHTSEADPDAKTIKLADLLDNTSSIMQFDRNFAVVYMKEKKLLLDVLTDGDETLWNRAKNVVDNYFNRSI